ARFSPSPPRGRPASSSPRLRRESLGSRAIGEPRSGSSAVLGSASRNGDPPPGPPHAWSQPPRSPAAPRAPGRPRPAPPRSRPAAGLAPRLAPAAVRPGVLQGDGQPQAGPAGGAGPGRVGPPEAAEDAGGLAGLEPDAVVPDGHRDRAPGGRQAHDDVLALAV